MHEVEKGRTIESPCGPIVHLDLRHLGGEADRHQASDGAKSCAMKYERIVQVKELIPVRPVVHT